MKLRFKQAVIGIIAAPLMLAAAFVAVPATTANAACNDSDLSVKTGVDCAKGKGTKTNLVKGEDSLIKTVTNVLLFIIGAISVIMIIFGGIKYVISNGDSSQITGAKNTILYSVIGLIIALLAYAIVNFVVDSFTSGSDGGGNSATN